MISINSILDAMLKEFDEKIKPKLLRIADERIRILYLLAWLNTFLEKHGLGRIIVVRGFAVELYTNAVIRTYDVDIDVESSHINTVREFLNIIGERIGRGYDLELVGIIRPIEIVPTTHLRDFKKIKVNNYNVYIWSPEATLIYLVSAWKYWSSEYDMYRAKILWNTIGDKMDKEKLCKLASEENVIEYINKVAGEPICSHQ
ncbi:MAG: hypothetical protein J7K21_06995 [Desulfurococcales archaeon]|nr:hypothetical protein [Desulfurococcales archaeon]